jgi:integrase
MYLATGAALRASEIFGQGGNDPDGRTLRIHQLQHHLQPQSHFVLTLGAHKTDQLGRGTPIVIGSPTAVSQLESFLRTHPTRSNPLSFLFQYPDGKVLTQQRFLLIIRPAFAQRGLDTSCISGHSFRKGAATGLLNAGNQDSIIKIQGRWKSNAYLRYAKPNSSTLINAARKTNVPHTHRRVHSQ